MTCPAVGRRLDQSADGYVATVVSGRGDRRERCADGRRGRASSFAAARARRHRECPGRPRPARGGVGRLHVRLPDHRRRRFPRARGGGGPGVGRRRASTSARSGGSTRRNAGAHADVTLVWPPAEPGGYSLIVDGRGACRFRRIAAGRSCPAERCCTARRTDCQPLCTLGSSVQFRAQNAAEGGCDCTITTFVDILESRSAVPTRSRTSRGLLCSMSPTHSDVDPAQLQQFRISLDVLGPLLRIRPMLGTVEVHAHAPLRPAHVEPGDHDAILIADTDLRLRLRKATAHQQQSGQRFVR